MSTRTIWTCDGCGADQVMTNSKTDWKRITVSIEGFRGYPVSDAANGSETYELCPSCQRRLADVARPNLWARANPEQPA